MRRDELDFGYELFLAAISTFSICNMVISYIPGVDPDAVNVVYIVDAVLSLLFIYDFFLRFAIAPSRSNYFFRNYGWADLLAIIPPLRFFRVIRIYQANLLVQKHGGKRVFSYLSQYRSESAVYILVLMVTFIIEAGAFLVLKVEHASPSANILTAPDAIWWVYVTITTVGYGDRFPVTLAGRLVGILVLTTGVAVFATFTGLISSKLLSSPAKEDTSPQQPPIGDEEAARYLAELRELIRKRDMIETEITSRIHQLEQMLKNG